ALNMPEPVRLSSREEVEKHFREAHLPNIIKSVETTRLAGTASRQIRSSALNHLVRSAWEEQRRFPLQIATVLSQQFAARGLQFFKVNRTVTHVAVARPHFLDMEATPVSEGVRRIVEYINAHAKTNRRRLMEALAPSPAPSAKSETSEAQPAEVQGETAAAARLAEPTPEQTVIITDLHWLIHQGHVIEFANGALETAKKPLPKPPKAEKRTATPKESAPAEESSTQPSPGA